MTKSVNIYSLSRIHDEQAFNTIKRHSSGIGSRIQQSEIDSLKIFVDSLIDEECEVSFFDGFFYGYKIPQISKEFDLLKFSKDYCINIELKSMQVSNDKILKQLAQNRHYLNHLNQKVELYTIITDSMSCYKLLTDNSLIATDINEIKERLSILSNDYTEGIDNMFRPSDYLVSPLNTPDKFLQGEYFLNAQQEEIKTNLLNTVTSSNGADFFHITGKPGTGKTLLLYDLAKELSKNGNTLLVHCGMLSSSQDRIKNEICDLEIIPAKLLENDAVNLSEYRFILVDETHRMYNPQFTKLCLSVKLNKQICIFSSDPGQILSHAEKNRQIVDRIRQLKLSGNYELSDRIRSNKELISFIRQMIDLNDKPKVHMDYPNIELNYANSIKEARLLIKYYRKKGFIFINYSKSNFNNSPYSKYIFEEDHDTHHVIGQEFDNVVILMDSSFFYNETNILSAISHPNPNYIYPNLFYQGVTRAREKLAIIIVEAPELFEKMSQIVIA